MNRDVFIVGRTPRTGFIVRLLCFTLGLFLLVKDTVPAAFADGTIPRIGIGSSGICSLRHSFYHGGLSVLQTQVWGTHHTYSPALSSMAPRDTFKAIGAFSPCSFRNGLGVPPV